MGDGMWNVEVGDAAAWLASQPDDSIDLLFTSPPYLEARTYGIGAGRKLDDWVAWMTEIVQAAAPKVRGLIAINCEGQTRNYRYLPAPFLLMADLHRAGFNLRKPPVFHRVGIPGSGGPDWLRNDYEPIVCVTRPGKLPWSDNTACGHVPKWAPGGAMSHRLSDGGRINQWGMRMGNGSSTATRKADGSKQAPARPSHVEATTDPDDGDALFDRGPNAEEGKEVPAWLRPGMHTGVQNKVKQPKPGRAVRGGPNGDIQNCDYDPPAIANPGNVLKFNVGGGQMGHELAHENEAPFPLELAEFFVKSFCPPGGTVADCFSGSGTTAHAAISLGRRFVGCDIRESQVALTLRRLATVTPALFA